MPEHARPAIDRFVEPHRFLSNFWPSLVSLDGITYQTVEHAYQAAKTLHPEQRARIAVAGQPGTAKQLGRALTIRRDWHAVKLPTMLGLLRQKFAREPLRRQLLATGDALLVEGNPWGDTFWGVCRGIGENHLGRLLMQVRDEIRKEMSL